MPAELMMRCCHVTKESFLDLVTLKLLDVQPAFPQRSTGPNRPCPVHQSVVFARLA
jgi:hypothetical protein